MADIDFGVLNWTEAQSADYQKDVKTDWSNEQETIIRNNSTKQNNVDQELVGRI